MGSAAKERSFERLKRSSTTERIFFGVSWNVLNLGYLFAPFLLFIFIYFSLYLSNDFLLRPLSLFFIRFIVFCFLSCLSWKLACVPPSVAVAFAVTVLPHFYPPSLTPSSPFPPSPPSSPSPPPSFIFPNDPVQPSFALSTTSFIFYLHISPSYFFYLLSLNPNTLFFPTLILFAVLIGLEPLPADSDSESNSGSILVRDWMDHQRN